MKGSSLRTHLAEYLGLTLVLGALIAFFSFSSAHFFTEDTFRTIANPIPDAIFMAVGMTFVLIIGGIDLSVGSLLGLCGSVLGLGIDAMALAAAARSRALCVDGFSVRRGERSHHRAMGRCPRSLSRWE